MFRPLSVAMFLGGVVACNSVALAQPVELLETLEVSATNSDGVWSSVVLEAGQLYWIYAEGSYRQAYAGQRCDAEWHQNLPGGPWEEEHVGEQYWYQHDLMIGGWWFDWSGSELPAPDPLDDFGSFFPHTLSSSQTYWLPYPGQGEPIRLWIFDTEYVDNQGFLTVQIWRGRDPRPLVLIETLEVPATNSTGVWSSATLEVGQVYWIYAEGSYRQAYAGQRCDAEWHQNLPGGPWEEEHVGEQYWYQHDLMIGGWWFDWWGSELAAPDPLDDFGSFFPHTLSSSQTYWLPYPGQGEPIRLWIFDTEYVDNQGSLTVRIWRTGCPGDVNGDGDTDQQDLGILLSAWGTCVGDSDFIPEADLDDDGCIGQSDLGILLADWNCGKG